MKKSKAIDVLNEVKRNNNRKEQFLSDLTNLDIIFGQRINPTIISDKHLFLLNIFSNIQVFSKVKQSFLFQYH